jgi:hypothetical protein
MSGRQSARPSTRIRLPVSLTPVALLVAGIATACGAAYPTIQPHRPAPVRRAQSVPPAEQDDPRSQPPSALVQLPAPLEMPAPTPPSQADFRFPRSLEIPPGPGFPPATVSLGPSDIRMVIELHRGGLRSCIERYPAATDSLEFRVHIGPGGHATVVDRRGRASNATVRCIRVEVESWQFPSSGYGAIFVLPLDFREASDTLRPARGTR